MDSGGDDDDGDDDDDDDGDDDDYDDDDQQLLTFMHLFSLREGEGERSETSAILSAPGGVFLSCSLTLWR